MWYVFLFTFQGRIKYGDKPHNLVWFVIGLLLNVYVVYFNRQPIIKVKHDEANDETFILV